MLFKKRDEKEIRKNINLKLTKIKDKKLEKKIKQDNLYDDFFDILLKLSFVKNKKPLIKKAKAIAKKIPELKGWPSSSKFWDAEALMWNENIPNNIRKLIKTQINKTIPKGNNLCLGSGSYHYVKNSVLLDYSQEMLNKSNNSKKVLFNLNKGKMPFKNNSFNSITAVFLINYIKDLNFLLKDAKRILKKNGKIIIVQSANPIAKLYRIKQKKSWKKEDVEKLMKRFKFKTNIHENITGKTRLIFFEGIK